MWVTKLLISPVKKRIFCPKKTQFGPKLAFLSIAGSFGALLVGWLVVMALAVSRKTPNYFIILSWRGKYFFKEKIYTSDIFTSRKTHLSKAGPTQEHFNHGLTVSRQLSIHVAP